MSDLPDNENRLNRGFLVPPGTVFNSAGQPVSPSLLHQSPEQLAAVARSMEEIKNNPHAFDIGGGLAAPGVPPSTVTNNAAGLGAPTFGDPNDSLIRVGMQAAQQNGVPWPIYYHAIKGESGWNPNIGASSAGARGIAQFIPPTAKLYGVDVTDPTSSLYGAARYLADLHKQGGSWVGALTGYLTGNPKGNPPQSVLRSNPSYARAFQLAAAQDSGPSSADSGGAMREPLEVGNLAYAGPDPLDPVQGVTPRILAQAGPQPAQGPALTHSDLQRGLAGVLQNGASGDAWQRLMVFSMMSQAMAAGTHKFVPISYDPWKTVPSLGDHIPMPVPNTGMML